MPTIIDTPDPHAHACTRTLVSPRSSSSPKQLYTANRRLPAGSPGTGSLAACDRRPRAESPGWREGVAGALGPGGEGRVC